MCQRIAKLSIALSFVIATQAGCSSLLGASSSDAPVQPIYIATSPQLNSAIFQIDSSYLNVDTDVEAIFALTEAQQNAFLDAFHNELSHLQPHQRLGEYLQRLTASYNYLERTLTAREAFEGTAGNCMSLVVLTASLAQLAELDIQYRQLTTNPIFDKQEGLILVSDHVRSRVYEPRSQQVGVLRSYITIDYFPTRASRRGAVLDHDTIIAMFYTNRAAEMLVESKLSAAAVYIKHALHAAPQHGGALNIAALLHTRAGLPEEAEAFYQYALRFEPKNINLLNNYQVMLERQSRYSEAKIIAEKIASLDNANPYQLMALGQQAVTQGDYQRAVNYYDQALDLAPYLQQAYLQKAVALEYLGHSQRAERTLREGLQQAQRAATESLFKQRVSSLKQNSRSAFQD